MTRRSDNGKKRRRRPDNGKKRRRPDNGKKRRIYLTADEQGSDPSGSGSKVSSKEKFVAGLEDEEIEVVKIQNDRISQLPEPILQHILCYLSTKQGFQSSTLSKSWRYICCTIPKLELRESFFNGNREAFFSFLETTLSRYSDQNISLLEFHLEISSKVDSEFVQTWIPLVFKAESLEELHLTGCNLNARKKDLKVVMLNRLRKLSLSRVDVSEVTLERIISSCPLIQHLAINRCRGLGTIKLNNHAALKLLKSVDFQAYKRGRCDGGIEIDLPNIECIRIRDCVNWHHSADYLSFSHLKSLHLSYVLLSEDSFHRFSVGMCCLEELTLINCFGFHEFKLASCSIKKLSLNVSRLTKAAIDVPTIRFFELSCLYPPSISFRAPSSEWKSKIIVKRFGFFGRLKRGPSSILVDVYQLHKALLCHSEFSLHITSPFGLVSKNVVDSPSPVVVENLTMNAKICVFPLGAWLGHLFSLFRPRNIHHFWYTNPEDDSQVLDNLLVNCLREFLSQEQLLMEEEEEEEEAGNRKKKIRFRLKWRE